MKNDTIEKLLNLTVEEKYSGIYLSSGGELYIGHENIPNNFTGECKFWLDNGKLIVHSHYKNGELHGECKILDINGTLFRYELWEKGKLVKFYV